MLPRQIAAGDLVVANDSRVLHARLRVVRSTGGAGELLLLAPMPAHGEGRAATSTWEAMARPARRLREREVVETTTGERVTCLERTGAQTWRVELPVPTSDVAEWLIEHGEVPLPPYITDRSTDPERYQTVHAAQPGSVAAPTAGLHFDDAVWDAVRAAGADVEHVTLDVGAGTFLPIAADRLDDHPMHPESFRISDRAAEAIQSALDDGRRIIAVGTTTTRVLESVVVDRRVERTAGTTDQFIRPGHDWRCVGALLTNFHLPRSTLVALVMSFHGVDATRAMYEHAIRERMRFYSFGDAMLVHGPPVG